MDPNESPLHRACALLKSQAELGRAIKMSPSMVNQMLRGKRPIPAEKCILIEKATGGRVLCEELRKDVDWGYLRGTKPAQEAQSA